MNEEAKGWARLAQEFCSGPFRRPLQCGAAGRDPLLVTENFSVTNIISENPELP
jgi:hypothetical protein